MIYKVHRNQLGKEVKKKEGTVFMNVFGGIEGW